MKIRSLHLAPKIRIRKKARGDKPALGVKQIRGVGISEKDYLMSLAPERASDPEKMIYGWLVLHDFPFQFQVSLMGGFVPGGAVVDFILQVRGGPTIIRVMGYWHKSIAQKYNDDLQRQSLEELGYEVVDVWDYEVNTPEKVHWTMMGLLFGYSRPTGLLPAGYGSTYAWPITPAPPREEMIDKYAREQLEELVDRITGVEQFLERYGFQEGTFRASGTSWEFSSTRVAFWDPANTTLPLSDADKYAELSLDGLSIRGGAFDIHTSESGSYMQMDGSGLQGYSTDEQTIDMDWSTGNLWAKKGGFGGTKTNPLIVMDDDGNVHIGGELHASVFVKGLIEAHAGTLVVAKSAGTLHKNVAVPGSGTWYIYVDDEPGGTPGINYLFDNSDICQIKSEYSGGVTEIWFTVSNRTDMGTGNQRYTCTYQSGTRSVTYRAGAPVLDYGQSGQGYHIITADLTNAPYWEILTHAGEPWTTTTPRLRIGNLNGRWDYDSDIYGFLAGKDISQTGDDFEGIAIDPTNGLQIQLAGGAIKLDSTGINLEMTTVYQDVRGVRLIDSSDNIIGMLKGQVDTGWHYVTLESRSLSGHSAYLNFSASAPSGENARLLLKAWSAGATEAEINFYSDSTGTPVYYITVKAENFRPYISGGVALGTDDYEWSQIAGRKYLVKDGVTAPSTVSGFAQIYVDTADGDLKVKFGDGTVKTIVVDT